ncbi:substrate-binding periplasmic protein [Pseudoalteromonas peptidolytica]|uniref:substrate-binding periplasmic protein n=1 Tax=Pseudoalteromonas peptidolytica TaxID=61150 RepID=UPI00298E84D9|nr:transporter substrate-binding domain-containing protein [Pseudoalteromonas peptidolytica]MDW7550142.1 transporter substrate-binding domain-containing protein [Pseudoalteromonas peptidolytica]
MQYFIGSVIAIFSAFYTHAGIPKKIDIYTEHFPPYQVKQKNGAIGGFASEIVRLIMWEADLGYQIYMLPWARAKSYASKSPYALLYSLAKTSDREANYTWIAPLCELNVAFYKRADVNTHSQWSIEKIKQHVVAVGADQLSENYLKQRGFNPDNNLVSVSSFNRAGGLLEKGRIDFIFGAENFVERMATRMGARAQWDKVLEVPDLSKTLYLTARKNAPEAYVQKLKKAAAQVLEKRHMTDVGCQVRP